MGKHFEVQSDGVLYMDLEPHPKRSRECYDAFSLSHIPLVKVKMDISSKTEQLSVFIPNSVVGKLPTLERYRESTAKMSNKAGERSKSRKTSADHVSAASDAQAPRLPGSVWGLLAVLKLLLQKKVDLSVLMLPNAYPPVGAEALAVRTRLCSSMCNVLERVVHSAKNVLRMFSSCIA